MCCFLTGSDHEEESAEDFFQRVRLDCRMTLVKYLVKTCLNQSQKVTDIYLSIQIYSDWCNFITASKGTVQYTLKV